MGKFIYKYRGISKEPLVNNKDCLRDIASGVEHS